jgi:hypothetical protein
VGDVAADSLLEEEGAAHLLLGQAEALEVTLPNQLQAKKSGLFGLRGVRGQEITGAAEDIEVTPLNWEAPSQRVLAALGLTRACGPRNRCEASLFAHSLSELE